MHGRAAQHTTLYNSCCHITSLNKVLLIAPSSCIDTCLLTYNLMSFLVFCSYLRSRPIFMRSETILKDNISRILMNNLFDMAVVNVMQTSNLVEVLAREGLITARRFTAISCLLFIYQVFVPAFYMVQHHIFPYL